MRMANANKHTTHRPSVAWIGYIYCIFRYENSNAAASRIQNYTLYVCVHKGPSRLTHSLHGIRAACFGHLNAASRYHVPCIYRSPSSCRREKMLGSIFTVSSIQFVLDFWSDDDQIRPTQWKRREGQSREQTMCAKFEAKLWRVRCT